MTEGEVSELVTLVCYEEAVPRPEIVYHQSGRAHFLGYHEQGNKKARIKEELVLPDIEWSRTHDPDCFSEGRYLLTVLHELAHHIAWIRHQENGHTPFMFAKAFQLYVRHGVDLNFAYENEIEYKPRAAKRGWDLFTRWALA